MSRYELSSKNKFWEIKIDGPKTVETFGTIGGEEHRFKHKTKNHSDAAAAEEYKSSIIETKLKEGYEAVDGDTDAGDSKKRASADSAGGPGKKSKLEPSDLLDEMRSMKILCGSNEGGGEASVFDIDLSGESPEDVFWKSSEIEGQSVTPKQDGDTYFKIHKELAAKEIAESWVTEDDPDHEDDKVEQVVGHLNSSADSSFEFARQKSGEDCQYVVGFGVVISGRALGLVHKDVVWT